MIDPVGQILRDDVVDPKTGKTVGRDGRNPHRRSMSML